MKALDQRARTIVKVASEIVSRQQGFFEQGVAAMKPLTLRDVAEAIEMHESTVSRVTSNKYLLCDRGMFELKYFFGSGVGQRRWRRRGGGSGQGRDRQADRRRNRNPERRCDIVDLLKDQGFDVARRTVVKYREAMGIGSSIQRRRQRKMIAAARPAKRQPGPDRQMVASPPRRRAGMDAGRLDHQPLGRR